MSEVLPTPPRAERPLRVLLVEDEQRYQDLARMALTELLMLPPDIRYVTNPDEIEGAADQHSLTPYDAAILDGIYRSEGKESQWGPDIFSKLKSIENRRNADPVTARPKPVVMIGFSLSEFHRFGAVVDHDPGKNKYTLQQVIRLAFPEFVTPLPDQPRGARPDGYVSHPVRNAS